MDYNFRLRDTRLGGVWLVVYLVGLLSAFASNLCAVAIEVQQTTLPQATAMSGFLTIDFASDVFVANGVTPLIFTIATTSGGHPCDIRFSDIREDGFDAICAEAPGRNGPHNAMDLHYIAIEPGVHSIPATVGGAPTTVTFAAGTVSTTSLQHGCASAAVCGTEGSTSISFGTTFSAAPSVLLQIQSLNSEGNNPPATVSTPFLTATIVEDGGGNPIISTTGADIALERSEVQQGTVIAETIAWLAVEPTSACTTLDLSSFGGPAAVPFESIVTAEIIDGWTNGCNTGEGAAFSAGCFVAAPAVVATKRSRNEDDGGWLRRCTNGFSATTALFTVDEDVNSGAGNQGDTERNHVDESASVVAFGADFFTPVTLDAFLAEQTNDGVRFSWSTATEAGNVGFHLYEITDAGWRRLTSSLVPSNVAGSLASEAYAVTIESTGARSFGISAVDVRNRRQDLGPFELGRAYGRQHPRLPVDWAAIRSEQATQAELRAGRDRREAIRGGGARGVDVYLSRTGLYRLDYDELVDAGLDLAGVPVASIAVLSRGIGYPRRVEPSDPGAVFGPGSFVEFFGSAVEGSLYTRTNVYQVKTNPGAAVPVHRRSAPAIGSPTERHVESLVSADNHHYSFASPTGDPWFSRRILAFTSPVTVEVVLTTDGLVLPSAETRLGVVLWGSTDFPTAPDHHVTIALNGVPLWEGTSDGLSVVEASMSVPAGVLQEGENLLAITVPGDTGVPFDLVHFESANLRYQRHLRARDGVLRFRARGSAIEVDGFTDNRVVAYRLGATLSKPPTLLPVEMQPEGGVYRARFPGDGSKARSFYVAAETQLFQPDRLRVALPREIPHGEARLLMIAHESFVDGLEDLVALRRSEGFSVLVVDAETIYHHYNHGVVDPEAIRAFVADAVEQRGTQHVLLVGGDTRDPLDHSGAGGVSFIPTPYVQTDDLIRYTPADALLADVDDDGFPDLPIGRLPVRSAQELATVIGKTVAFSATAPGGRAVFAADDREPMTSFQAISEELIRTLPAAWNADRVYLDELDPFTANETLLEALAESPTITSFIGHSGSAAWTFDGLLNVTDVRALVNPEPMVVFQWGCWNTYHVDPAYDTLGHAFLLNQQGGAAAVLEHRLLQRWTLNACSVRWSWKERWMGLRPSARRCSGPRKCCVNSIQNDSMCFWVGPCWEIQL